MKVREHDRRDWIIVLLILLFGLLCILAAGQWALRFTPNWELKTNMGSNVDPNSDFLTRQFNGPVEPIDPAILTQPIWIHVFLTPGASFPTGTPFPKMTSTSLITIPPLTITPTTTGVLPPTQKATSTGFASITNTTNPILPPFATSTKPNATYTSGPTSTLPSTPTATPTFTSTHTPTLTATPPFTPTSTSTSTLTLTFTDTPVPSADLQITKTDGATDYTASGTTTYTIVVSNFGGPSSVNGALVTDSFPAQISSANWTCAGVSGATCTASGSGNINDSINLPVGSSVTYTVTAIIGSGASGALVNTATVSTPVGIVDPVPGNNTATDSDQLIQSSAFPYGNIGSVKDGIVAVLPPGTSVTLSFGTPLVVNGHPSWDLIYYEWANGTGIQMDWVILQISDGRNWYTILNWGNNNADTNINLDTTIIGGAEPDNRDFTTIPNSDILFPFGTGTLANPATGVTIELDGFVPNGTYPYIRIISPSGDSGDGCEVDAIVILP